MRLPARACTSGAPVRHICQAELHTVLARSPSVHRAAESSNGSSRRYRTLVRSADQAVVERALNLASTSHDPHDNPIPDEIHCPDAVVGVLSALEELGQPELSTEVAEQVIADNDSATDIQLTAAAALPTTPQQLFRFWDFRNWSSRARGLILFNCIVPLCASNWILLKMTEKLIEPSTFATLRFGISALAFAPFLPKVTAPVAKAGIEVGFWAGIGYLAQAQGLLTTDASRSSFLGALTVIIVPLLCGLSGRGVKPVTWGAAGAAFVGMALLEQGGVQAGPGDLWSIISALAFGIQMFRTENYARKLPKESNLPLISVMLATIASMSFLLTASQHVPETQALLANPAAVLPVLAGLTWKQIITILYTGVLSTDGVLLIEVTALQDIPSTDGAIIYTLIPVFGGALAWFLLGERWGAAGFAGAALIIGSSVIAQKYGMDSEVPEKEHAI